MIPPNYPNPYMMMHQQNNSNSTLIIFFCMCVFVIILIVIISSNKKEETDDDDPDFSSLLNDNLIKNKKNNTTHSQLPNRPTEKAHSVATTNRATEKAHSVARTNRATEKAHSVATINTATEKAHSVATINTATEKAHSVATISGTSGNETSGPSTPTSGPSNDIQTLSDNSYLAQNNQEVNNLTPEATNTVNIVDTTLIICETTNDADEILSNTACVDAIVDSDNTEHFSVPSTTEKVISKSEETKNKIKKNFYRVYRDSIRPKYLEYNTKCLNYKSMDEYEKDINCYNKETVNIDNNRDNEIESDNSYNYKMHNTKENKIQFISRMGKKFKKPSFQKNFLKENSKKTYLDVYKKFIEIETKNTFRVPQDKKYTALKVLQQLDQTRDSHIDSYKSIKNDGTCTETPTTTGKTKEQIKNDCAEYVKNNNYTDFENECKKYSSDNTFECPKNKKDFEKMNCLVVDIKTHPEYMGYKSDCETYYASDSFITTKAVDLYSGLFVIPAVKIEHEKCLKIETSEDFDRDATCWSPRQKQKDKENRNRDTEIEKDNTYKYKFKNKDKKKVIDKEPFENYQQYLKRMARKYMVDKHILLKNIPNSGDIYPISMKAALMKGESMFRDEQMNRYEYLKRIEDLKSRNSKTYFKFDDECTELSKVSLNDGSSDTLESLGENIGACWLNDKWRKDIDHYESQGIDIYNEANYELYKKSDLAKYWNYCADFVTDIKCKELNKDYLKRLKWSNMRWKMIEKGVPDKDADPDYLSDKEYKKLEKEAEDAYFKKNQLCNDWHMDEEVRGKSCKNSLVSLEHRKNRSGTCKFYSPSIDETVSEVCIDNITWSNCKNLSMHYEKNRDGTLNLGDHFKMTLLPFKKKYKEERNCSNFDLEEPPVPIKYAAKLISQMNFNSNFDIIKFWNDIEKQELAEQAANSMAGKEEEKPINNKDKCLTRWTDGCFVVDDISDVNTVNKLTKKNELFSNVNKDLTYKCKEYNSNNSYLKFVDEEEPLTTYIRFRTDIDSESCIPTIKKTIHKSDNNTIMEIETDNTCDNLSRYHMYAIQDDPTDNIQSVPLYKYGNNTVFPTKSTNDDTVLELKLGYINNKSNDKRNNSKKWYFTGFPNLSNEHSNIVEIHNDDNNLNLKQVSNDCSEKFLTKYGQSAIGACLDVEKNKCYDFVTRKKCDEINSIYYQTRINLSGYPLNFHKDQKLNWNKDSIPLFDNYFRSNNLCSNWDDWTKYPNKDDVEQKGVCKFNKLEETLDKIQEYTRSPGWKNEECPGDCYKNTEAKKDGDRFYTEWNWKGKTGRDYVDSKNIITINKNGTDRYFNKSDFEMYMGNMPVSYRPNKINYEYSCVENITKEQCKQLSMNKGITDFETNTDKYFKIGTNVSCSDFFIDSPVPCTNGAYGLSCQNGGTPIRSDGICSCTCVNSFTGPNCETGPSPGPSLDIQGSTDTSASSQSKREVIKIITKQNKTYYLFNHRDMNKTQSEEINDILTFLVESKEQLEANKEVDATSLLNIIHNTYYTKDSSKNDIIPELIKKFKTDDNGTFINTFIYSVPSGQFLKYLSKYSQNKQIFISGTLGQPWGDSNNEIRDPTSNNRSYFYVFNATLRNENSVDIVDTVDDRQPASDTSTETTDTTASSQLKSLWLGREVTIKGPGSTPGPKRKAIKIVTPQNKTYYMFNHIDENGSQFDEIEHILTLFSESKTQLLNKPEVDMTDVFNLIHKRYGDTDKVRCTPHCKGGLIHGTTYDVLYPLVRKMDPNQLGVQSTTIYNVPSGQQLRYRLNKNKEIVKKENFKWGSHMNLDKIELIAPILNKTPEFHVAARQIENHDRRGQEGTNSFYYILDATLINESSINIIDILNDIQPRSTGADSGLICKDECIDRPSNSSTGKTCTTEPYTSGGVTYTWDYCEVPRWTKTSNCPPNTNGAFCGGVYYNKTIKCVEGSDESKLNFSSKVADIYDKDGYLKGMESVKLEGQFKCKNYEMPKTAFEMCQYDKCYSGEDCTYDWECKGACYNKECIGGGTKPAQCTKGANDEPCENGGTATGLEGACGCYCINSYTGPNCKIPPPVQCTNNADGAPCDNGGTAKNWIKKVGKNCAGNKWGTDYQSRKTSLTLDQCKEECNKNSECKAIVIRKGEYSDDGDCVLCTSSNMSWGDDKETSDGYVRGCGCSCIKPFEGTHCQTNSAQAITSGSGSGDDCTVHEDGQPCQNGGLPYRDSASGNCRCDCQTMTTDYKGSHCQEFTMEYW